MKRLTTLIIGLAGVAVMSFTTFAVAQEEDEHAILDAVPKIATSVPGVDAFPAPPEGFNPLTATNIELLTYGLPQRPDKTADAKAYQIWERAMLALKIHADDVKARPYSSHRMVPAGPPTAGPLGTVSVGSYNWSGVVTTNTLTAWSTTLSFTKVSSVWNVPVALPPFGAPCSDGPWLISSWNGIGGYSEGSLVQGGSSAYTGGPGCDSSTEYSGWVEWVPSYSELDIYCNGFPCYVGPGDDFYAITYGAKGTVEQYVFVEDITQQWGGTYGMTWKSGPGLIGTSAEYIVERPCCISKNVYYPLVNYILDFFDYSFAYDGAGTLFYPGASGSNTAVVTMYADDGKTAISYPKQGTLGYQGQYSLWFEDTNCAYSKGCAP